MNSLQCILMYSLEVRKNHKALQTTEADIIKEKKKQQAGQKKHFFPGSIECFETP